MLRSVGLWILGGILVTATVLRLWQLDVLPPGFHLDESFEGLEAWRILTDPGYRPIFLTGNFGVPPFNAYANALMFGLVRLLGGEVGPVAMRTTAAIFGVLGVLAVFALGRELQRLDPRRLTRWFPFFAAAVLATLRWHIHFSRIGIEPVIVPLLWAAAVWLFLRGWRTGGWPNFVGAGVVLALAMYTYQAAWIIPVLMIPLTFHLWFWDQAQDTGPATPHATHRKPFPTRLTGPLLTAIVALLLVAPLFWFFTQNQELLWLRPSQIATTSSDAGDAGRGGPVQNTLASAAMFFPVGATGDPDPRRNLPGEAALNWWQAIPFAIGVVLALRRLRNPAYGALIVGLGGLLLPGVFSEYAPHFHRVLGAAAPAALLCAVGLDWAAGAIGRRLGRPAWGVWVGAAIICIGAFVAARDYFVRWAALPDLFYAFDAGLWEVGQEIARRAPTEIIYLTPRPADHPTLAFALDTRAGSHPPPISFDGRQIFPVTAGKNAQMETYVVIEAEDFRTRLLLPEVLPAAKAAQPVLDAAGQVYANYYVRPVGAEAQRPPQTPLAVPLGDGIALAGYDVQPATLRPGAAALSPTALARGRRTAPGLDGVHPSVAPRR